MITGPRVTLRPFREEEVDAWLAARQSSAGDRSVSPVGVPPRERLVERVERSGVMQDGWMDLAIETEGRLAGEIGTYNEPGREITPGTYFLGIGLFASADRGRGLGTEATRLLCDWLFHEAGADRVETSTAVTNTPMRRVVERLGFHLDGTRVQWEVEWAVYSVAREDWDALSPPAPS